MKTSHYIIRSITDWLTRRRSLATVQLTGGISLVALGLLGGHLSVDYEGSFGALSLRANSEVYLPLSILAFVAGLGLIIVGLRTGFEERALLHRRRWVVVEQRGLRNTADTPLAAALGPAAAGSRIETVLTDIRSRLRDGAVVDPEGALEAVTLVKASLEARTGEGDRADGQIAYGGLMPVPYTFLTGMLLDDENRLSTYDWDRTDECWRLVEGADDGDRFVLEPLPASVTPDTVLSVSVSYRIDPNVVAAVFPMHSAAHLRLPLGSADCHWSAEKQAELARTFLETVKSLAARGAKTVHLLIAAPNSVVFRLGRAYDKRNLPAAIVYQYEASRTPPYPWGVQLPTSGIDKARIVYTGRP